MCKRVECSQVINVFLLTFNLTDILPPSCKLSPVGKVWYWDRKSRNRWLLKTKSKFKSTTTGEDPSDQDNEGTIPVRVFFFHLEKQCHLFPTGSDNRPDSCTSGGLLCRLSADWAECRAEQLTCVGGRRGCYQCKAHVFWCFDGSTENTRDFLTPPGPQGEKKQSNSEVWAMQGSICMGPQKLNQSRYHCATHSQQLRTGCI